MQLARTLSVASIVSAYQDFKEVGSHVKVRISVSNITEPCIMMIHLISDVDECASDLDNDCHDNATCDDLEGSYECHCKIGFIGDGIMCSGEKHNLIYNFALIVT